MCRRLCGLDRAPSLGGSDQRTEHQLQDGLSPNAFGMILSRRRSSTKRRSASGDAGVEVAHEACDQIPGKFKTLPSHFPERVGAHYSIMLVPECAERAFRLKLIKRRLLRLQLRDLESLRLDRLRAHRGDRTTTL